MKLLQALAALFQNLVYYQLDAGVPAHYAYFLEDVTCKEVDALILQPIPADDTARTLCAAVFSFIPGQALPLYGGMNEFLSTVAAQAFADRVVTDAVALTNRDVGSFAEAAQACFCRTLGS